MNKNLLGVLVIILSFALTSFGADYYVNFKTGLNSNTGGSARAPWKTITYALSKVSPGPKSPVTIKVAVGTYNKVIGESFPLQMKSYLTIIGDIDRGKTYPTIDATGSNSAAIVFENVKDVSIEYFKIKGGSGYDIDGYHYGGGIYCAGSYPIIKNCTITENIAQVAGGIYITDSEPKIINCNITNNDGNCYGGIGLYFCLSFEINGCKISQNNSSDIAGGLHLIYVEGIITDSQISENTAALEGGGVYLISSGSTWIINTIIDNNMAGNDSYGGGIYIESLSSQFIMDCQINNNKAGYGAGIYCNSYVSLSIKNTIVDSNESKIDGGGLYFDGASLKMKSCTITTNNSNKNGGGIFSKNSSIDILNCLFSENRSEESGGAVYSYYTDLNILDTEIAQNDTSLYGGGLCSIFDNNSEVTGCVFRDNSSMFGGGLSYLFASGSISNSVIENNAALKNTSDLGGFGGGIYAFNKVYFNLINCLITDNYAKSGGAFYALQCTKFFVYNSTFENNSAQTEGDAVTADDDSYVSILNSILWNNGNQTFFKNEGGYVEIHHSAVEGGYSGEGIVEQDPLFTTGPYGEYYLSQTASGQSQNSPCMNTGRSSPKYFGIAHRTTRTDGVFDKDTVDMGFHYPPLIRFNLYAEPMRTSFKYYDSIKLYLDIRKVAPARTVDLYFFMEDPADSFVSGFSWTEGINPVLTNVPLPETMNIKDLLLLEINIPNANPPIMYPGTYKFYFEAVDSVTKELISNVSIAEFDLW